MGVITHGDGAAGSQRNPLYGVWATMRTRCSNPNFNAYKNYGGRGVAVCQEWNSYPVFKTWALRNGYSSRLELDRIDVNGNYEPQNCRWLPRLNNRNKRNNRYVTAFGERKELAAWAEDTRCVVSYVCLKRRLNRGVAAEVAITSPAIPHGKYSRAIKKENRFETT